MPITSAPNLRKGTDMKNYFKPGDFESAMSTDEYIPKHVAKIANEKLKKLIESWPVVYGTIGTESHSWQSYPPGTFIQENYTHKASLAFIEEIKKDCVKHEPQIKINYDVRSFSFGTKTELNSLPPIMICKFCGVELQATWSEKK